MMTRILGHQGHIQQSRSWVTFPGKVVALGRGVRGVSLYLHFLGAASVSTNVTCF